MTEIADLRLRGLIKSSLRVWWHRLFDLTPELSRKLGIKRDFLFNDFMEWAAQNRINLGWQIHLQILIFLEETGHGHYFDENIVLELLAATGSSWAGSTFEESIAIRLVSSLLSDHAVVAIKSLGPKRPRRILKISHKSVFNDLVSYELFCQIDWK